MEELPDPTCTYTVPQEEDIDAAAVAYLEPIIEAVLQSDRTLVVPLTTTGDGSCLLHAISRGLWGLELFSGLLRARLLAELQAHRGWYVERIGAGEYAEACAQAAGGTGSYLSNVHAVAVAHVLRRPIAVYGALQNPGVALLVH